MPVSMLTMNNMIKKKYLPFYEDQQLNFYIRSRSNPEKVKEFYTESAVLRPVMHSGNLWNTIKNLFKKGKDFTKKTMDFIDNTPILKDLKDVGFDMIKEKTGVDPNVYYDTAKNVINKITPTKPKTNQPQPQNQYVQPQPKQPQPKQPSYDYNQQLKNYYQNIMQSPSLPQVYKPQVEQNYKAFSLGSELAGGNQTIMRNLPKLLLISKSNRGGYTIKKDFKPLLDKFGIKTLALPKTLKDFIEKVNNKSNGRLYLGNGKCGESGPLTIAQNEIKPIKEPRSNGKNKIDRYNEILNKLKK